MALTAQIDGKDFGCSTAHIQATAAVIREVIKAASGTIYAISVSNTNATVYYAQIFNLATPPVASDGTGFMFSIPIPANTAVGGREMGIPVKGIGCPDGIAIKICGGGAGNDNSVAATGVTVTVFYR
jgi:hypothetical protein